MMDSQAAPIVGDMAMVLDNGVPTYTISQQYSTALSSLRRGNCLSETFRLRAGLAGIGTRLLRSL